jgi:hypothetical protein
VIVAKEKDALVPDAAHRLEARGREGRCLVVLASSDQFP